MAVPALGGRQHRRQVAPQRIVRERERRRLHVVAGVDLLQELLRDCHQRGALLDRELLECERLVRLRKAVLVGRPPEALEVMDVVDDRDSPGKELERDHGQGVREVVAVDEVGAKLLAGGSQAFDRLGAEVPPALKELVT
jgi:hypothetical protein